ncbi:MAG: DUF2948 family protein [Kordiimonadaceae bacterium]|nr:DUF2948 family protein [Kordiimonadaceae bacterium]
MSKPLKLIAQSDTDLAVISSLLQDCTMKIGDISWVPGEHRFAFVGNRYQWEKKRLFRRPKGGRVRVAFHASGISNAQLYNIDMQDSETVLDLLNIEAEKTEADEGTADTAGYTLLLNFSGGAAIRLQTETIDAVATDLGESWEAIARPAHD